MNITDRLAYQSTYTVELTNAPDKTLLLTKLDLAKRLIQSEKLLTSVLDAIPFAVQIKAKGETLFSNQACKQTNPEHKQTHPDLPELEIYTSEASADNNMLLDILAHQLRTPVTGVVWNAELAENATPDQLKDLLANISESGAKLKRTVADLILALELERGNKQTELKTTDIVGCIKNAVSRLDFADKQVDIKLTRHAETTTAQELDEDLITAALAHIMQNSIDYSTDATCRITISIKNNNGDTNIKISDDGPGLEDDINKLLQKYQRGKNSRIKKPDGNGLGLYIANAVIAMHNGEMQVTSDNNGTVTKISIPHKTLHSNKSGSIIN